MIYDIQLLFLITTPDNEIIYVDNFKVIRIDYKNHKLTHFVSNLYGMNKGGIMIYKDIMFQILRMKARKRFLFGSLFCSLLL